MKQNPQENEAAKKKNLRDKFGKSAGKAKKGFCTNIRIM